MSIKLLGSIAEIHNAAGTDYVKIGGFTGEFSLNPTAERDDRTVADDTRRRLASTIIDGGNMSLNVRYSFTDVGQAELEAARTDGSVRNLRITFENNDTLVVPVYVKSLPAEWSDLGSHGVGSYNFKVAGQPTVTDV